MNPRSPSSYTDLAYSQQLAADYEGELIFVPRHGWHAWDGELWMLNPDAAMRAAKSLAERRLQAALDTHTHYDTPVKLAIGRCSAARIRASLKLAETDERLTMSYAQLQAHPGPEPV
ncbi:MAG TPA: hypothetical protein VK538_12495 [Solirubrobacteraceae bacterium]|nr:hypothetical protein [Solirubrobacteraceae bacterium]